MRRLVPILWLLAAVPTLAFAEDAPLAPKLTRPPKLLHFAEAVYPESERATGRTATVVLRLTLGATGAVEAAEVVTSAGPAFDQAAVTAAKQCTFEPAEIDGKPASIRLFFNYEFMLKVQAPITSHLSGTVTDRGRHLPMKGVLVELDSGEKALTGADGRFDLPNIKPGRHAVMLSGAGLTPLRTEETLTAGEHVDVSYEVSLPRPSASPLPSDDMEIVVTAPPVQQQVVSTTVTADQAVKVPGTQGDVLKVVESMPGVARAAIGSNALIVWGAAPQDTRTYIGGIPVPELYHQGGLRSVMASDFVQNVELIPGGYGAAYGNALGGLIVVDLKPLEGEGVHGSAAADLFDASGTVRAALSDRVEAGLAARVSYLDQIATPFVSSSVQEYFPFPRYFDGQGRLHVKLSPRESVELIALLSGDSSTSGVPNTNPELSTKQTNNLNFYRIAFRYENQLTDGTTISVIPYFGSDRTGLVDTFGSVHTLQGNDTTLGGLRASWRSIATKWLTTEVGLDAEVQSASMQQIGSPDNPPREGDPFVFGEPPPQQLSADRWQALFVNVAPYGLLDFAFFDKTLHLTPSLRLDPYVRSVSEAYPVNEGQPAQGLYNQQLAIEPRFSLRWDVTPRVGLHAAAGRYDEMPAAADLSAVFGNPNLPIESGNHYVAGTSWRITKTLMSELTGFFTQSWWLAVRSPLPQPLSAQALVPEGSGRAYGAQLMLRQELMRGFFGWVSYTLSRSERQDVPNGSWRLSDYDQTHLLTLAASYEVGRGVNVGLRVRYASGFPRTPVVGAYYDTQLQLYEPEFGAINSIRIPAFVQLDLRVAKVWKFQRSELELSLDVQNVTNQANAEEIVYSSDFTKMGYITGLPIMPVLGIRWSI